MSSCSFLHRITHLFTVSANPFPESCKQQTSTKELQHDARGKASGFFPDHDDLIYTSFSTLRGLVEEFINTRRKHAGEHGYELGFVYADDDMLDELSFSEMDCLIDKFKDYKRMRSFGREKEWWGWTLEGERAIDDQVFTLSMSSPSRVADRSEIENVRALTKALFLFGLLLGNHCSCCLRTCFLVVKGWLSTRNVRAEVD